MNNNSPVAKPNFIGTAGWSIPKIYASSFPAEGSHLQRYATVFSAVEINSSFYRPPRQSTYERWAASVPDHFRFSVKAPKAVSHSDWHDTTSDLDAFFMEIAGLGRKLGPILIQLPPKRVFEFREAERFISAFRQRTDGEIVLEPRHASWMGADADDLLRTHHVSRVAADPPPAPGAERPGSWTGLAYWRQHGSPEIYRSSYETERLVTIAGGMMDENVSNAWCIFDNTTAYAAAGNALELKEIIAARGR